MKVYLLYDQERQYPLHGEDAVDTVEVYVDEVAANAVASERNSACKYPVNHDLFEEWVVVETELVGGK